MHEGTWRTSFVFITDSLLPNRLVDYIGRRSDGRTVKIARFLHVNLTVLGTSQKEWGKEMDSIGACNIVQRTGSHCFGGLKSASRYIWFRLDTILRFRSRTADILT